MGLGSSGVHIIHATNRPWFSFSVSSRHLWSPPFLLCLVCQLHCPLCPACFPFTARPAPYSVWSDSRWFSKLQGFVARGRGESCPPHTSHRRISLPHVVCTYVSMSYPVLCPFTRIRSRSGTWMFVCSKSKRRGVRPESRFGLRLPSPILSFLSMAPLVRWPRNLRP